jgi:hypothetical protein
MKQTSTVLALSVVLLACAPAAVGDQALVRQDGRWRQSDVRTLDDLRGFRPRQVRLSRYGGLASGPLTKATGFFRTQRIGKRWWLVDPEGRLFLTVGLCSVNLSMFDKGAEREAFGGKEAWATATAKLLRSQGFNTLGRWSDWEEIRRCETPLPYTTRLSFMSSYAKKRDPKNGPKGLPQECQPVFDPEFAAFCDRYASRLAKTKSDPWLLGHFTDNEIPFRPYILRNYLKLPETDPGHVAARRFLVKRGKRPDRIDKKDEADYLTIVADRYYSTVVKAIRKHDPNHLVIGSRLNGRNINDAVFRGSRSLDVVSLNYYHRWSARHSELQRCAELSGRPVLQSEWYANVGEANAGYLVKTQRDRGRFYVHHALSLLEDPNCIGWHWFKYGTHVDKQFRPHAEMTELMRQLNESVYGIAAHFGR